MKSYVLVTPYSTSSTEAAIPKMSPNEALSCSFAPDSFVFGLAPFEGAPPDSFESVLFDPDAFWFGSSRARAIDKLP